MSLSFDGSNDEVSLASQQPSTSGIVWSAWIKPTSMGENDKGIVAAVTDGRPILRFNGTAASNKLRFDWFFSGNDLTYDTPALTLDTWTHVLVTYNASSTSNVPVIYIDGVAASLTTVSTPSGTAESSSADFDIGGRGGVDAFAGLIGEVAWWDALEFSAAEAASVYMNGALSRPGMYLYWPMDDTGTAHALDFSGNARNGTISGAVLGANPPVRPCGRRG